MRTFRKLKPFGTGLTGATGGKKNDAVLVQNPTATTQTVTLQCLNPAGGIVTVGPLNLATNTITIFPFSFYGFTGSTAALNVYELF